MIQRAVEEAGIPTTSISLARGITERVRPPRAVYVRFPFGAPFGEPHAVAQQRRLLLDVLSSFEKVREPGGIMDLPYRWKRESYD